MRTLPTKWPDCRLALDEKRAPFSPTLWSLAPNNDKTKLKQVWFPGHHACVGGGDHDHGLSNITIAWMVEQVSANTNLQVDLDYLANNLEKGENPCAKPWGCADFVDSYQGIFKISGQRRRTPGKYSQKAGSTHEYIHRSALARKNSHDLKYVPPDFSTLNEDEFGEVERKLSW